jgi:hypothetical protein
MHEGHRFSAHQQDLATVSQLTEYKYVVPIIRPDAERNTLQRPLRVGLLTISIE